MHVYVLSVSRSRIKVALAELTPEMDGDLPPDGRLGLSLTRSDLPIQEEEVLGSGGIERSLARIRQETAGWSGADAVVTLADWDDVPGDAHAPLRGQTVRVNPAELTSFAQAVLLPEVAGLCSLRLALAWAQALWVPLLTVPLLRAADLPPEARETGIPGLKREPRFHALNCEMAARDAAFNAGKRFSEAAVVSAYLGRGSSVTAYQRGRPVSSTGSGLSGGVMGLRQAGSVSPAGLQRLLADGVSAGSEAAASGALALSAAGLSQGAGAPVQTLWSYWTGSGGVQALTGHSSVRDLMAAEETDPRVQMAAAALVHQVACAIGQQVGALSARPDALAITGPLARWDSVMDRLDARLSWMAPVFVMPGDLEIEAVARAAGRALLGWAPSASWPWPLQAQGGVGSVSQSQSQSRSQGPAAPAASPNF